jgi:ParB-like chromosome segregation protein Spo0J
VSCTAVADVAIVGGDVNALRVQFAGLVDKVTLLGEQAKRTETDIVEVKTRVGVSDAKVLELTSRLAQIETSVGQLAPRISQVEEQARDAVARLGKLEQSPPVQPVVLQMPSSMPETLLQGMIRTWCDKSAVAEAYIRTFVLTNAGTSGEALKSELKMAAAEAKLDENSTEKFVKWAKGFIPADSATPDGASQK